jgi:hypothetical protein
MNILIINIGFIGDSLFAASLAENCKKNGYDRVDLLIGFPQTFDLLKLNPHIDNVYQSDVIGAYPGVDNLPAGCDTGVYDVIYPTAHSRFSEKFLDTYNRTLSLPNLDYSFNLYLPEMEFEMDHKKPKLAFHTDWDKRSFQKNGAPRDSEFIIRNLTDYYDVYRVGANSHFEYDTDKSYKFLIECGFISKCDLFFGFPGGMHWVAAGTGIPTVTTSEHMMSHFKSTGDFKGSTLGDFKRDFMLHASHHFPNQDHTLLEPEVGDLDIITYLIEKQKHFNGK